MILVTGGAGFIGSHIVRALCEGGEQVRVLDDLSSGHLHNLDGLGDQVDFRRGSITNFEDLCAAMEGVRLVFHEAARPSVTESLLNPLVVHEANASGTLGVFEAARRAGVKRLVCASSSAIYGENGGKLGEEGDLPQPLSPYAAQKLQGEHYASIYSREHGLETAMLRYYNVFGPRQDPGSPYSGVISIFCSRLLAGEVPTIYGDGLQTRDFIFVEDVVRANLLAAEVPLGESSVFNVATGQSVTLLDLFHGLTEVLGMDWQPLFAEARGGDIRHSRACTDRAVAQLGFKPVVAFQEGLRKTLEWYRTQVPS